MEQKKLIKVIDAEIKSARVKLEEVSYNFPFKTEQKNFEYEQYCAGRLDSLIEIKKWIVIK